MGALHGKRARKRVFITTGSFSGEARDYMSHIEPKVVLIDGRQLTEYMVDFGLGVTTKAAYEIKRIDSDYFAEQWLRPRRPPSNERMALTTLVRQDRSVPAVI